AGGHARARCRRAPARASGRRGATSRHWRDVERRAGAHPRDSRFLSLRGEGVASSRRERGLRRLLRREPELGDAALAQDGFLDFAGDGHREGVDEAVVARDLVMRNLTAAEGCDLLAGRGIAGAQLDPGAELLAVALVGNADHLHVLDLGVAIEELLDLA